MRYRQSLLALFLPGTVGLQVVLGAGPLLTWTQMGDAYRPPDPQMNWGFAPREFNGTLLAPMGDYGACVVKRWTGTNWVNDFLDDDWGTGRDFENLTFLMVYGDRLYMTCETDSSSPYNHGVMRRDAAGNWSVALPYTRTPEGIMQFGSFGMAVHNGRLCTGVVPYEANTTLTIYEYDGTAWAGIKTYKTGEQLRAWSLGSDGDNLYVGIGTRGRQNAASLGIERYDGGAWSSELSARAMHSMAWFKGTMYAGGNGRIYRRSPAGTWSEVLNTGQAFVIAMTVIDYGGGNTVLYAGSENRPRLYATTDGVTWDLMHEFDTSPGGCYVGQFQNAPVASVTYYEGSTPKVVKVWRGEPLLSHKATDPNPADGAGNVTTHVVLSWSAGNGATSRQVFFGTTDPPAYWVTHTATSYDPGPLSHLTHYYWRIDEVSTEGTTTGDVWRFTTAAAPGDFDADNDVDQSDFGYLQVCFSGAGHVHPPGCDDADLDGDGDVDQTDFAGFEECRSGANQPPACD